MNKIVGLEEGVLNSFSRNVHISFSRSKPLPSSDELAPMIRTPAQLVANQVGPRIFSYASTRAGSDVPAFVRQNLLADIVVARHEPDRGAKHFDGGLEIGLFLRLARLREVSGDQDEVHAGRVDLRDGLLEMPRLPRLLPIRGAVQVSVAEQGDARQNIGIRLRHRGRRSAGSQAKDGERRHGNNR